MINNIVEIMISYVTGLPTRYQILYANIKTIFKVSLSTQRITSMVIWQQLTDGVTKAENQGDAGQVGWIVVGDYDEEIDLMKDIIKQLEDDKK